MTCANCAYENEAVYRYEGTMAQLLGDAEHAVVVLLLFGSEWMSRVKPWVKGYSVSPLLQVIFKDITIEK
jgi:hypothetical protein